MSAVRTWAFATALGTLFATPSAAATTTTQVTGELLFSTNNVTATTTFACTGAPTCVGSEAVVMRDPTCASPTITFTAPIQVSGLALGAAGSFQGTYVEHSPSSFTCVGCSCTVATDRNAVVLRPFNATWNGSTSGTLVTTNPDPATFPTFTPETGNFSTTVLPAPPPVFPISVTSNITASSATATARIQPRPQDAGVPASVYVFAHARASAVSGALLAKDGPTPDVCVLAQLDPNGKLVSVSGSSLTPYATGVLSSQGQAVNLLNNVQTANVSGATFFVGYGSSSTSMLQNGIYEGAVSIPGSPQCNGALLAGAAPSSPKALSGLWWNSSESGWGIGISQRDSTVFAAWYTYDSGGNPKWYVASNCALPAASAGPGGKCTGTLYEVSASPYFGAVFDPAKVSVTTAGSITLDFADANAATMSYTLNGESRVVPVSRQVFGTTTPTPAVDYTDLWWTPQESGWGMIVTQRGATIFLAWFVYGNAGHPTWYVVPDCAVSGSGCNGTVYKTLGPPFGGTFDPSKVQAFPAGTAGLNFLDANNAILSYSVNQSVGNKFMTRQLF